MARHAARSPGPFRACTEQAIRSLISPPSLIPWNCLQTITSRLTGAELEARIAARKDRWTPRCTNVRFILSYLAPQPGG